MAEVWKIWLDEWLDVARKGLVGWVTGRVGAIRCLEVGSSTGRGHQTRLEHCKWYPGWVWKVGEGT